MEHSRQARVGKSKKTVDMEPSIQAAFLLLRGLVGDGGKYGDGFQLHVGFPAMNDEFMHA
jgi:hypothetical protein